MGFSLKGLLGTAAGIAPYALSEMRQQDAISNANDDRLRSDFYRSQANDRANDLNTAQVANLGDDGWSKPIPTTGPDGNPMLVQQDRHGNIRPAIMGGDGPPAIPGVRVTPSAPAPMPMLPGGPSLAASIPKQAPAAPPTTTTPLSAGAPSLAGQIRPYEKPTAAPKIDPNSAEGIAAAKQKADNAAVARASRAVPRPVAAPKIDPNSAAGIAADSAKAANRAALRPGGMTGGMGSGGIGGLARQASAITEMDQANDMLTPFEQAVRGGTANYTGLDYFTGLRGKMYDAHGVVDQATHAAAFAHLNQVNPGLANYLRAAELWALADGTISGRTSDFRTKLDGFVSAIGPNAGTAQIDNTQKARKTRLDELHKFKPAMEGAASRFIQPGAGGSSGSGGNINLNAPSPLRQKYDAAASHLRAQGKSDADILKAIGQPPEGE
jgi:hypothetical protein